MGARPATSVVINFIDRHRVWLGVEPTCRALAALGVQIAPSTFYAGLKRPPSRRALRDEQVLVEVRRVWSERRLGRGVYGPQGL